MLSSGLVVGLFDASGYPLEVGTLYQTITIHEYLG